MLLITFLIVNLAGAISVQSLPPIRVSVPPSQPPTSVPSSTPLADASGNLTGNVKNFRGCSSRQKYDLRTAFRDATEIAKAALPVDVNDYLYQDFFGPPQYSSQYVDRVQNNLNNLAKFTPSWYEQVRLVAEYFRYSNPVFAQRELGMLTAHSIRLDWIKGRYIQIYCDDPSNWCGITKEGKKIGGYALNNYDNKPSIVMCPSFYLHDDLTYTVQKLVDAGPEYQAQLAWMKNRGSIFLHEMLHLDIIAQPHITDQAFPDQADVKAYGPKRCKSLARRGAGGAEASSLNADSYTWYATGKYFQKKFKVYPRSVGDDPTSPTDFSPDNWQNASINDIVDIDVDYSSQPNKIPLSNSFDTGFDPMTPLANGTVSTPPVGTGAATARRHRRKRDFKANLGGVDT